jgi:hypothetical protein
VRDDVVYVAMGDLVTLDVSKPAKPRVIGSHAELSDDEAWAIALTDTLVCTLGEGGLSVWA